jgi:hypothetical protein
MTTVGDLNPRRPAADGGVEGYVSTHERAGTAQRPSIWASVDRLIDAAPDLAALRANRIHLLAADRWRTLGRVVPATLEADERLSGLVTLVVPELIHRVRSAYDGPLVVKKGPEIAARYPDAALRPYIDLDLLVPDAASVRRALLDSGFAEVGDPARYRDSPHGLPLHWPGSPLLVEVHAAPNVPPWLQGPSSRELLAHAVPSSTGIDGVLTLAPFHHVLLIAAHSWAHGPMTRLGDLVDVTVMSEGLDEGRLVALARRWGMERLWRTTRAAADAVLFGGPKPWALRLWARNLASVRERTVLENHIGLWIGAFSALGVAGGVRAMSVQVGKDLRPEGDETWANKLSRARLAVRHARVPKSDHDEQLARQARRS